MRLVAVIDISQEAGLHARLATEHCATRLKLTTSAVNHADRRYQLIRPCLRSGIVLGGLCQ